MQASSITQIFILGEQPSLKSPTFITVILEKSGGQSWIRTSVGESQQIGRLMASRYVRPSDVRITSRLKADTKSLVAAGLGSLLTAAAPNVIEAELQPLSQSVKMTDPVRKRATR